MNNITNEKLISVLSKMFGKTIACASYQFKQLQGGTLGDVRLVTGTAEAVDGEKLPYQVVWKKQKKWERPGDSNSWRREYDLYISDLGKVFTDSLRWPICYYAEMNAGINETQLWMEYIDGASGLDLTVEMFEKAAYEIGRFQGKLYSDPPGFLSVLKNLSDVEALKYNYLYNRSQGEVYSYIRSENCEIPEHLCQMLIGVDDRADEIWSRIETLPVVLCHRDFWVTNIFYKDGNIILIDWDTTGWGYLGEDMASLIADEADVNHMVEYYRKCVPAYYKGFAEYANSSYITKNCVYELILLKFGYRLVDWYMNSRDGGKALCLNTLQKIYEMKNV